MDIAGGAGGGIIGVDGGRRGRTVVVVVRVIDEPPHSLYLLDCGTTADR